MKTSTDVAMEVRNVLLTGCGDTLQIGWSRHYNYAKEAVIVPHHCEGEGSLRVATVYVNIHVKDVNRGANKVFETNLSELNNITKQVSTLLRNHVVKGEGYNWVVSSIMPPLEEPNKNEHFVSVILTAYIRSKQH